MTHPPQTMAPGVEALGGQRNAIRYDYQQPTAWYIRLGCADPTIARFSIDTTAGASFGDRARLDAPNASRGDLGKSTDANVVIPPAAHLSPRRFRLAGLGA